MEYSKKLTNRSPKGLFIPACVLLGVASFLFLIQAVLETTGIIIAVFKNYDRHSFQGGFIYAIGMLAGVFACATYGSAVPFAAVLRRKVPDRKYPTLMIVLAVVLGAIAFLVIFAMPIVSSIHLSLIEN